MHATQRKIDEQEAEQFCRELGDGGLRELLDVYCEEVGPDVMEDEVILARYLKMRQQGVSHVFARMSACRRASGAKGTDRAFDEHARARMNGMSESDLRIAQAAGIQTQGKFHMSGLGPLDDPKSWVSDTNDIRQVCMERNYSCEGHVNHQGVEVPPRQIDLAPDLVDEMVQQEFLEDPALAQKVKRSPRELDRLRHLVREKYGRSRKSR